MVGPDRDGTLNDVRQLIDKYQLHDSVEITGVLSKEMAQKNLKTLIYLLILQM